MMRYLTFLAWPVLLAVMAVWPCGACGTPADAPVRVTVTLRAAAQVSADVVTLADVAMLAGGPAAIRHQVAAIDLEELPAGQKGPLTITATQVAYRLQLAGISAAQFELKGAAAVEVRRVAPTLCDADILAAARLELGERLPWPAADVDVKLARSVQAPALKLAASDSLRLVANLPPERNVLGRVKVNVGVYVNDCQQAALAVEFDVRLYQQLAVAVRRIDKGQVLTAADLHPDRRAVTDASRYLGHAAALTGQKAKRAIPAGQVLTADDVEPATEANPVLVRPADQVKLVAQVGALRLEAAGEALQQGRAGDFVWVRNNSSKAVLKGRVVEAGVVEVKY